MQVFAEYVVHSFIIMRAYSERFTENIKQHYLRSVTVQTAFNRNKTKKKRVEADDEITPLRTPSEMEIVQKL